MAKVFTQEEREKIKGQVVELVRQSGRETLRQLEAKTGVDWPPESPDNQYHLNK